MRTTARPRPRLLRWFALALVGATAVMLVACGGSADDGAPRDTTSGVSSPPMGSSAGGLGEAGVGGKAEDGRAGGGAAYEAGDVDDAAPSYPGGDGQSVTNIPNVLGRTIIRNGSVSLEVESVSQSLERARQIAETAGGFVAESNFSGSGADQVASLTMRIPAERFGDVVAELQGLAVEVKSVTSSSQDVTEEFTDLQSSLRNLQAVEQQYLTLLGQAEDIEDIIVVQDRLNGVRANIEQVQGRLNLLENLSSLATIRVSLVPVPAVVEASTSGPGFGDRVAEAWESSLDAIETVATTVAVALVWSWWLIPFVMVAAWIVRRLVRASERPRVDTPEGAA